MASSADDVSSETKKPDATYIKESKKTHPPYSDMVHDAIQKMAGRKGVSRVKVCEHIKTNYQMDEVNNLYVKKAIKTGLKNNIFENSTGTGVSGSFKMVKGPVVKKPQNPKTKKPKETEEKPKSKETEEKPKKSKLSKKEVKAKDDLELLKVRKKASKKPPVAPTGKENKKAPVKRTQKVSKENVKKALKKSNSTGDLQKK